MFILVHGVLSLNLSAGWVVQRCDISIWVSWIFGAVIGPKSSHRNGGWQISLVERSVVCQSGFGNSDLKGQMGGSRFCKYVYRFCFFPVLPVVPCYWQFLGWDAMFVRSFTVASPDVCLVNCFMANASRIYIYIYIIFTYTYTILWHISMEICFLCIHVSMCLLYLFIFWYIYICICMQQITPRLIVAQWSSIRYHAIAFIHPKASAA